MKITYPVQFLMLQLFFQVKFTKNIFLLNVLNECVPFLMNLYQILELLDNNYEESKIY